MVYNSPFLFPNPLVNGGHPGEEAGSSVSALPYSYLWTSSPNQRRRGRGHHRPGDSLRLRIRDRTTGHQCIAAQHTMPPFHRHCCCGCSSQGKGYLWLFYISPSSHSLWGTCIYRSFVCVCVFVLVLSCWKCCWFCYVFRCLVFFSKLWDLVLILVTKCESAMYCDVEKNFYF